MLAVVAVLLQGCWGKSETSLVEDYLTALASGEFARAQRLIGADPDAFVDEYFEGESHDLAAAYFSQLEYEVRKSVKAGDRITVPVKITLPDYDAVLDQVIDEAVAGFLESNEPLDFDEIRQNLEDALRATDAPTETVLEEFVLTKTGGEWEVVSGPFVDGEFWTGLEWVEEAVALGEQATELRGKIEQTKREIAEAEEDEQVVAWQAPDLLRLRIELSALETQLEGILAELTDLLD